MPVDRYRPPEITAECILEEERIQPSPLRVEGIHDRQQRDLTAPPERFREGDGETPGSTVDTDGAETPDDTTDTDTDA